MQNRQRMDRGQRRADRWALRYPLPGWPLLNLGLLGCTCCC